MIEKLNIVKRVSISPGNTKMGAIPSVSLPPVKTCCDGCPCAAKCYAAKICRLRPSVRNAYENNLSILLADPSEYWNQVRNAVKMARYFRFHVSGDIADDLYFYDVVLTAKENPHCEILAFTKQYEIVNRYLDGHGGKLPKNLHIIFSLWDPAWNVRVQNPYDLPTSAVIFKDQPEKAAEYSKICPGNCAECAARGVGCWELKKGETIAFYEH